MTMNRNQAMLDALILQRNEALNNVVNLSADLQVANARIADLERELEALKPKE